MVVLRDYTNFLGLRVPRRLSSQDDGLCGDLLLRTDV